MKAVLLSLALAVGQMMSMQEKPVVHLKPHSDSVDTAFNGMLLELDHSPEVIHLPKYPPSADPQGAQWSVDIKNFGPHPVTVIDRGPFSVTIHVNQLVHIYSNGIGYYLKAHE
jgi:hypothetical protein